LGGTLTVTLSRSTKRITASSGSTLANVGIAGPSAGQLGGACVHIGRVTTVSLVIDKIAVDQSLSSVTVRVRTLPGESGMMLAWGSEADDYQP
jgi:hypothetical protein